MGCDEEYATGQSFHCGGVTFTGDQVPLPFGCWYGPARNRPLCTIADHGEPSLKPDAPGPVQIYFQRTPAALAERKRTCEGRWTDPNADEDFTMIVTTGYTGLRWAR